jgi:hypothetical protein
MDQFVALGQGEGLPGDAVGATAHQRLVGGDLGFEGGQLVGAVAELGHRSDEEAPQQEEILSLGGDGSGTIALAEQALLRGGVGSVDLHGRCS